MEGNRPDTERRPDDAAAPAEPRVPEPGVTAPRKEAPETAREPAPHIVHAPEPDAGNLIPAKDEPGTL